MKNVFKVLIFLCSVHMAHALQGLRITVQSPDVVLSWPSDDSQPNSYAILYRASLGDPWQLLASYYPPDYGTNMTYYTDPGAGVNNSGLYEVVMMGPNPCNLTNGQTLSGIIVVPVEAYEPAGSLDAMTLYCDETPVPSTAHVAPFEKPVPLLVLDTTQLANGPHNFSVLCEYRDYGTLAVYEDTSTPEISVVVSNAISFPNWLPFFGETGNAALIAAQCPSNSDWYIDVYGDTNRYIGTMSGHTTDGSIYIPWDLTGRVTCWKTILNSV
jgi:hypothetical protein